MYTYLENFIKAAQCPNNCDENIKEFCDWCIRKEIMLTKIRSGKLTKRCFWCNWNNLPKYDTDFYYECWLKALDAIADNNYEIVWLENPAEHEKNHVEEQISSLKKEDFYKLFADDGFISDLIEREYSAHRGTLFYEEYLVDAWGYYMCNVGDFEVTLNKEVLKK